MLFEWSVSPWGFRANVGMTIKPGVKDLLWMAAGAAVILALTLVVVPYAGVDRTGTERLAVREKRLDLVDGSALADRDQAHVTRLAPRDGASAGNAVANLS